MSDLTVPDEFCVQCGRKLGISRWHIAGATGPVGTVPKHGPFCSTECLQLSKPTPPIQQWTGSGDQP